MIEKKSSLLYGITLGLVLFLAAVLIAAGVAMPHYGVSLADKQTKELTQGWTFTDLASGESREVSLPMNLEDNGAGFSLTRTLMRYGMEDGCILVQSHHMHVQIYLNGGLIYASREDGWRPSKTPGNIDHIVRLPQDFEGGELRIDFQPLLGDAILYTMLAPVAGSRSALLHHLVAPEMPTILFVAVVGLLGAVLFIVCLVNGRRFRTGRHLFYMSVFTLLCTLYCLCETEFSRLIIENSYVINLADFLALALIPLPILAMLLPSLTPRLKRITRWLIGLVAANFLVQTLLNFLGVDLRLMVSFTHVVIALCIALIIHVLIATRRDRRGEAHRFLITFVPMAAGAVIDMILFYTPLIVHNNFFTGLGLLAFLILQLHQLGCRYLALYKQSIRSAMYAQMAYTDALTNIGNRAAYQRHVNGLEIRLRNHARIWCLVADLNNLKLINDTFGHSAGDVVIQDTAFLLSQAFGEKGSVYRTGGDEFSALAVDITEAELLAILDALHEAIGRYNANHRFSISLATGYAHYRPGEDATLEKMEIRADNRMYANKRKTKGG